MNQPAPPTPNPTVTRRANCFVTGGRARIEAMAQAGFCPREIAGQLGWHRSTIQRELARGGDPQQYRAGDARRSADARAARPKVPKLGRDAELATAVQQRLDQRWWPHAISADLRRPGPTGVR